MSGSTVLNIKLYIAILSGLGFITVLAFVPFEAPNYKEKYFRFENKKPPQREIEKETMPLVDIRTKKEKFSFKLRSKGDSQNNSKQEKYSRPYTNSFFKNIETRNHSNSNFMADFNSPRFEIIDDRFKQYPTSMMVISFASNKYYSIRLITGESTFNYPYRFFINEANIPELTRVSMGVGLKHIVLNIKYNYLQENLMRTSLHPEADSVLNKDYAVIGFTFFLDRYKKYSIYLGHNYYNIMNQNRPSDSSSGIPSFSASFRGRNTDFYNSSFFFNFKNNTNRDYYYSSFGVFRLPIASHIFSEYATSLGLELSF